MDWQKRQITPAGPSFVNSINQLLYKLEMTDIAVVVMQGQNVYA